MIVIGLTGGIGTGKSTVSSYLKQKGCKIIDADDMSRKMTEKGSSALEAIRDAFGDEYFSQDGSLNRKALGNLVFSDKRRLDLLQQIITSKVVKAIEEEVKRLKKEGYEGIAVIDAPLLFECNLDRLTDENWLVTADMESRIDRVAKRDDLSKEQILSRMKNQIGKKEAEKKCRCILDNSGTIDDLKKQVDENVERVKHENKQGENRKF